MTVIDLAHGSPDGSSMRNPYALHVHAGLIWRRQIRWALIDLPGVEWTEDRGWLSSRFRIVGERGVIEAIACVLRRHGCEMDGPTP